MHLGAHINGTKAVGHIAHGHATPAPPTADDALQQGATVTYHTPVLLAIERPVIGELLLMAAKLRPADIARVMLAQKHGPVVALDLAGVPFDAGHFAWQGPLSRLCASIDIRSGVERIVQDRQDARVTEPSPHHLAFALALPKPRRYLQAMVFKMLHHG